jgi:acyl-CoA synthetase (AMP-forming)/AMP-acid ligase II/acyl carrier protein
MTLTSDDLWSRCTQQKRGFMAVVQRRFPGTVPARLQARASERPDQVALEVVGAGALTFSQWDQASNQVARGLAAEGVRHGQRVVIPCDSHHWLDYAVAYVAVQKAGATTVPVLLSHGQHHLTWVCEASGAVGVISDAADTPIAVPTWTTSTLAADRSPQPVDRPTSPDDEAEILYTSGTTGVPKGVSATHANLLYTHSDQARSGLRVVLHSLPPGALAGQGLMMQALDATPHHVIALPHYETREFLATVAGKRVTDVVLVPALALALIQARETVEFDLSSVEVVRTMSAPIPPVALQRLDSLFPNASVINMYTTTESWPARTRMRFDRSRPESVGRSSRAGSVRIVDDNDNELPPGTRGNVELNLAGAPPRQYVDAEKSSTNVFLPSGWVRTGDVGYVDEDGYLYLIDRHADLVISGGLNVSTIEVESAIQEFPGVLEAAAFGLPHRILGEYVIAAVRTTGDLSVSELNQYLEDRLGSAKAPKRLVVVDDFPRNAMGKIVKRELREKFSEPAGVSHTVRAGESALAERVSQFWADALGVEAVPGDIPFVELGGSSISAMEVAARVREELGRKVSQRSLFEATSLDDFVDRVVAADPASTEHLSLGPIRRVRRTSSNA